MREPKVGDQVLYMHSSIDGIVRFPAIITGVEAPHDVHLVVFNGALGQTIYCRCEHGIQDGGWSYSGEFGVR